MIHRSLARIVLFGLCSYVARPACAEVSVLIVTPADEARDYSVYESRLRSELLAAGFSVSAERVPGTPDFASLASNAERSASQAAIAISVSEGELCGLLWIGEQSKTSGMMRPIRCCPLDDAAPLVFAVRATDALSAGLLELRYPQAVAAAREATPAQAKPSVAPQAQPKQHAPSTATVSPKPTPSPARKDTPHLAWNLQASGVAAAWLREFPIAYGAKLEFTRDFYPFWTAGLQGYALAPASVARDQGRARISQFLAGATTQYRTELSRRLSIAEGLGVGVYGIDISADAVQPFRARHAFSTSGYVSFEHQVHFEVVYSLSIVAGLALSVPWKRYSVIILDTTVARAAAPLLLGNLGLQLSL